MKHLFRLGVDAGGTFTDFILSDAHGKVLLCKSLSTPQDGTLAIADGLRQLARLDVATRQRMGGQGRQFVLDNHTYPVLARRFLDACRTA